MEKLLLWAALSAGVAGWVCSLALGFSRRERDSPAREPMLSGAWWGALLLPVLVWLFTLPSSPPFSSGQGFGRGFLLAGLLAWATHRAVALMLSKPGGERNAALPALFAGLVVASVALLWLRGAIIESLLGAILGWTSVAILSVFARERALATTASKPEDVSFRAEPKRGEESTPSRSLVADKELKEDSSGRLGSPRNDRAGNSTFNVPAPLAGSTFASLALNGSAWVAGVCGVCLLGVYRDFAVAGQPVSTHPALALGVATSVALALLCGALVREVLPSVQLSEAISLLLVVAAPLGAGYLLSGRLIEGDLSPLITLGAGVVLGLSGWGLGLNSTQGEGAPLAQAPELSSTEAPFRAPLAILVALCGFMLAFGAMQGFGVGLLVLAAWPVSILMWAPASLPEAEPQTRARREAAAQTLAMLGALLVVLLLSRVFATRFRVPLRGASFSDQFALFGFVAGAALPFLLASIGFDSKRGFVRTTRLVLCGALALLIPGAMLSIWNIKVAPAFFAGMAISLGGLWGRLGLSSVGAASGLLALALSGFLCGWANRFLPLAEATRSQRSQFLLWGLGAALALVLIVDYGARLLVWASSRKAPVAPTGGTS